MPYTSDYGTKLHTQISSGTQPDVVYLDVDLPYQLIPYDVLLDLTPALTEVGRSKNNDFASLTDVFLDQDGKVYGLPKDFTSMALFSNTDLVQTPPKAVSSSRSPPTSAPPGRGQPSSGSAWPASSWAAGSIPS